MTKEPRPPKSEGKRRKETKRIRVEVERRLEEARSKLAGGLIESIERERKSSFIRSLQERIRSNTNAANVAAEVLVELRKEGLTPSSESHELIQLLVKTHESIRVDFKDIMGMSDEKLEEQFPRISAYFVGERQAMTILVKIQQQEAQMHAYSLRMVHEPGISKKRPKTAK